MPMLMFYRMLVMAELFTAEFLLVYRMRKRRYFSLRFIACIIVGEGIAAVLPLYYNAIATSLTFVLMFLITVPMIKFCVDECWKNVIFCGVAAYTMQHFAYGLSNFFLTLLQSGASPILGMYFEGDIDFSQFTLQTLLVAVIYAFAYFIAYTLAYTAFVRKLKRGEEFLIRNTGMLAILGVAVVLDVVLNSVIVYFAGESDMLTSLMNIVYENICCFFLLYAQFKLLRTGALENEVATMQYLLREKERQYNLSKDNIELINMKCHDLRHQIRSVSAQQGLPREAVKEIEKFISIYDAVVRTGNEVLDTILTEKSLICKRDKIALACVADGRALEFMEAADVYALFGNALDNAIEAVLRMDEEMRHIDLAVKRVNGMVSVEICNLFDGNVKFGSDGFPVTGKEDRDWHGIGIKSIRNIAEKYNGVCNVTVNDDTFILNVLLFGGGGDVQSDAKQS